MSVVDAGRGGAVYDRGYRPYEGARGQRGAATFALYKASMRRALGIRRSWRQKVAPFVLLGIVTIPAIVNVGIGYVTRDRFLTERIEIITYRDYVGVSSALLLFVALVAPDVVCPDRRQHVLPLMFARPITGVDYVLAKLGAIATILFAFSFLPQVVLFVGNMLVSDSALDYFTGHLDVLWKVPVAVALLAVYYAVIGVAISSLTDRRIVAGAAVIGLFLVTSIASGIFVGDSEFDGGSAAGLINVLALPLYLRDLVFLGHVDPESPLNGVDERRSARDRVVRRRAAHRHRGAPAPLSLGGTMTAPLDFRATGDPAFAPDATVTVDNVSVWFGQKVALSELSCSFGPGVTGLLGPNGAGKTTLMRAITGLIDVNQGTVRIDGSDPRRDREVFRRLALVPEDEAVPSGLTARQFVRYVADLHGVADSDRARGRVAVGRDARRRRPTGRRVQQGHAAAHEGRGCTRVRSARARARRTVERRRPGPAPAPHRAVQAARRAGPHRDRQLARPQRGRAAGGAGDRPHPRPAGGGGWTPRDPRRDGRSPPARARPLRRRTTAGVRADRARLGRRRDLRRRCATGS